MSQNKKKYDELARRTAVLWLKYRPYKTAPESIRKELSALASMKQCLKEGIEADSDDQKVVTIDGNIIICEKDRDKYIAAKEQMQKYQRENMEKGYISPEDIATFEYPRINFRSAVQEIVEITAENDPDIERARRRIEDAMGGLLKGCLPYDDLIKYRKELRRHQEIKSEDSKASDRPVQMTMIEKIAQKVFGRGASALNRLKKAIKGMEPEDKGNKR